MQHLYVAHISHVENPLTYYIMLENDTVLNGKDIENVTIEYNDIIYNRGIPYVSGPQRNGTAYKARLEGVSYAPMSFPPFYPRNVPPPSPSREEEESEKEATTSPPYSHAAMGGSKKKYLNYKVVMYPIKIYVEQFLKKSEWWVLIEIVDIDKYKRLIIRVYDPITRVCLNDKLKKKFGEALIPFFGKNGKSRVRAT